MVEDTHMAEAELTSATVRQDAAQQLTAGSKALFQAYAEDADNWSGNPLVGGNVEHTLENNGHLTHLKKLNLLTTFESDDLMWIVFTCAGIEYAKAAFGIYIEEGC